MRAVTARSGDLVHEVQVDVQLQRPQPSGVEPRIFGLALPAFFEVTGVLAALVVLGGITMASNRRRSNRLRDEPVVTKS